MSAKERGSITFGTEIIKTDEYLLLAQTMKDDLPIELIDNNIQFIDKMLGIMKMESIIGNMRRTKSGKLRKNSSLQDVLMNAVGQLVDEENAIKAELNII